MPQAYIVDAPGAAGGRRNGACRDWHAGPLVDNVRTAVVKQSNIDPVSIEDVLVGSATQASERSDPVGRSAMLSSILPKTVPAVMIVRQCGSSQQAIRFAAQAVISGMKDMVIVDVEPIVEAGYPKLDIIEGANALTHPLGASRAKLKATLPCSNAGQRLLRPANLVPRRRDCRRADRGESVR